MSASAMQNLSRVPQANSDAQESTAQQTNALRTAQAINGVTPASISALSSSYLSGPRVSSGPASIRTGLQIIPSPNDAYASLQSSASQIARLQSNPEQPTARAASEAYQTQAGSKTQISQQTQASGSLSVNVMV